MRKQLNVIICFFTINMFVMQASLADSNSPIPIGDADSVPDMVAHISATLEEQGFTVILVVDHAAAANSVVSTLHPHKLFLHVNLASKSDNCSGEVIQPVSICH